ncbi:uncharacterized protein Z520_09974 [Fonsecaea multimorphosa CBS 102226]|uniref:Uncharacterized protein n=1 Tax=Fonsecaea multimorphosa CBS 102226 TaxID=1442371 RepID=A0A0D2JUR3_9EURO|nr:uncharacterized protein Z520_09974 [Fonsecaea multimorphosa CBS 102226]KIX94264.1 hypothetical protein Z520_09974 [Fonsecaea multimorphosa CBS 102226]OAL19945.1 hypothetical protein AYO22_09472 [Fonsecaea multimorphosa]
MGFVLRRSLPSTIVGTADTPPAPVSTEVASSAMAGSGFINFTKTILLPLSISLFLYLMVFYVLLPLYRRHRARYSQYLPLPLQSVQSASASLSSRLLNIIAPAHVRHGLPTLFTRLIVPSTWSFRRSRGRSNSIVSVDEGTLFDEESGEAMVGFDAQERNRRRDAMERQVSNMDAATRTVSRGAGMGGEHVSDSNRRLSRELEEGFRDDSDNEDEDDQVVVGRRGSSARA